MQYMYLTLHGKTPPGTTNFKDIGKSKHLKNGKTMNNVWTIQDIMTKPYSSNTNHNSFFNQKRPKSGSSFENLPS